MDLLPELPRNSSKRSSVEPLTYKHCLAMSAMVAFLLPSLNAAGAEPDPGAAFGEVCKTAVSQLGEFIKICETNARGSTRIFYPGMSTIGIPESHYVFFEPSRTPSHFGLGCTLDQHRQPEFVGIYYTLYPTDFGKFNELPIARVSGSNDVVLINSGAEINLLPMRKILAAREEPCLIQKLPKLNTKIFLDNSAEISAIKYEDQIQINFCYPREHTCLGGAYTEFFGKTLNDIVGEPAYSIVIGSRGEILTRETDISQLCLQVRNGDGSFGIRRDLCDVNRRKS